MANPKLSEHPRQIGKDTFGDTYLLRWKIFIIPLLGWELMLHVFLRSDHSKCLHDHPSWFWSLIIAGNYDEIIDDSPYLTENAFPKETRQRKIHRRWGSLAYRKALHTHRVIAEAPVVTLVLIGKPFRMWGYWNKHGLWNPWDRHRKDNTYEHEC